MTDPAGQGLTILSPILIEFPALCAECGESTDRTATVAIDRKKSQLGFLLFLIPSPFRELITAAWELWESHGAGPKSAKIPFCKACARSNTLFGFKILTIFITGIAVVFALLVYMDTLPAWIIAAGFFVVALILLRIVLWLKIYRRLLPVKISRDKLGYHYHFHAGVYRALAEREGFHRADLTSPPAPPPERLMPGA